jgi:hypothetical protein
VPEKDPVAVGLVGVALQVADVGWSDLDPAAQIRESLGQLRAGRACRCRVYAHRQQVDVRVAMACLSGGNRSVEVERRVAGTGQRAACGGEHGFEYRRHA